MTRPALVAPILPHRRRVARRIDALQRAGGGAGAGAAAARQQLIEQELIAYRAQLYQVLALPGTVAAPRPAPRAPASVFSKPGMSLERPEIDDAKRVDPL